MDTQRSIYVESTSYNGINFESTSYYILSVTFIVGTALCYHCESAEHPILALQFTIFVFVILKERSHNYYLARKMGKQQLR